MGFQDESGISLKPFVRKTWAQKGKTPIITCSGSWKKLTLSGVIITKPNGASSRLFLRILTGNMNGSGVIQFLKDLKRHLRGEKILLFMDGLPAHRAHMVTNYLKQERHWLRVERLPGYAPECNPIEYLWGALKKKHLGNARCENLTPLVRMVKKAKRVMDDSSLLHGFLGASGLY